MSLNLSPETRKMLLDVCNVLGVEFSTHDDTIPRCLKAMVERMAVLAAANAGLAKRLHQLEAGVRAGPLTVAQGQELPPCPTCQGRKTVMSAGKPITLPDGSGAFEAVESVCPACNGTGVRP